MRNRGILITVAIAGSIFATGAFADEVTTTTTTRKTDPTVVVTPPPGPAVVDGDAGCSTKKVTKTDGDTGDTVQKKVTNCD